MTIKRRRGKGNPENNKRYEKRRSKKKSFNFAENHTTEKRERHGENETEKDDKGPNKRDFKKNEDQKYHGTYTVCRNKKM